LSLYQRLKAASFFRGMVALTMKSTVAMKPP
jgi:hypothetical protein